MLLLEVKQTLLGHFLFRWTLENSKGGVVLGIHFCLEIQFWFWRNYCTWSAGWVMGKAGLWNGPYGQTCGQDKVLISSINVVLTKRKWTKYLDSISKYLLWKELKHNIYFVHAYMSISFSNIRYCSTIALSNYTESCQFLTTCSVAWLCLLPAVETLTQRHFCMNRLQGSIFYWYW